MRHLLPCSAKFIAGAKAYRIWVETDEEHMNIAETLSARIQEGRRVIVSETRLGDHPPIDIEEYGHAAQAAHTSKLEPAPTPGVRVSSDFPDSEIDGADEDLPPAGS